MSGFFYYFLGFFQGKFWGFLHNRVATLMQTGKAADMSELRIHYCTTPGQCIWFLRTVGIIPANKMPMQESNQFNRT